MKSLKPRNPRGSAWLCRPSEDGGDGVRLGAVAGAHVGGVPIGVETALVDTHGHRGADGVHLPIVPITGGRFVGVHSGTSCPISRIAGELCGARHRKVPDANN